MSGLEEIRGVLRNEDPIRVNALEPLKAVCRRGLTQKKTFISLQCNRCTRLELGSQNPIGGCCLNKTGIKLRSTRRLKLPGRGILIEKYKRSNRAIMFCCRFPFKVANYILFHLFEIPLNIHSDLDKATVVSKS